MTINLRTGAGRLPDPIDYNTKVTAVCAAAPGTPAPLWAAFLDRVTAGDLELQEYLQRVAGYCLTGSVAEHALFFLHGTGANGKSVFVNTVVEIMGDYALTIGTEMLMVSHTDRHPSSIHSSSC
jgi:putative DNA primase/helicase